MFFRAEQMSSVQFLSKVTYETTNGSGPLCPFFFFPHMSVFDETVDIFLSAQRSEIARGLPWIQSALAECSFEWLC